MKKRFAYVLLPIMANGFLLQGCGGGGAAGGSNSDINPETMVVNAGANQVMAQNSIISLEGKGFSEKENIEKMNWIIRTLPSDPRVVAKMIPEDGSCVLTNDEKSSNSGRWKSVRGCSIQLSVGPSPTNQEINLTLIATDAKGNVRSDDVTVQVASGASKLVVDAGPDLNVGASSSVSVPCSYTGGFWYDVANPKPVYRWYLSNSAEIDLAGVSLSYTWDTQTGQLDFNAPALLPKAVDAQMVCEVTDESGAVASDSSVFHLSTLTPLVASAGVAQNVVPDASVTLDASGTIDPTGGSAIYYQWKQLSGELVSLIDANNVKASFTSPHLAVTGDLVFEVSTSRLPITSSTIFSPTEKSQTVVTVQGDNEVGALVVSAGDAQSVSFNKPVTLTAKVTDLTGSTGPYFYRWEQIDDSGSNVVLSNANTATASFIAPSANADLSFRVSVSRQPITSSTVFATTEQSVTSVVVRDAAF